MRVLVTDGGQRAALAVVRSLGRAGHSVFVCAPRRSSLAGASRYCRLQAAVIDPSVDHEGFLAGIHDLIGRWQIDAILPITEPAHHAILPHRRTRFGHVLIPCPEYDAFLAVSNKERVMGAAINAGVRVPLTLTVGSASDLDAHADLPFPLVVKPWASVVREGGRFIKTSVSYASNRAELRGILGSLPREAYPVLLQERIEGPGTGVFLLIWGGEVLASFAHRRLREVPPSGGVSVLRESIPLPSDLSRASVDMLRQFGWQGVAMIEYKVDSRTGAPYIMEVNGRFWGSLQLSIDAGVDFPRLLMDAASGHPVEPVRDYRSGVVSRWTLGEIDHLIARLRRPVQAAGGGTPISRHTAFTDCLASISHRGREEILRASDPMPAARELLSWLRRQ